MSKLYNSKVTFEYAIKDDINHHSKWSLDPKKNIISIIIPNESKTL
ncbi:hypothetical protein [Winogradskyella jejuensis]|nr:hypothetical protein [Winogradskyella jejuensis]